MSINLSNSTPAAPAGKKLVTFQTDGAGNVSAYIAADSSLITSVDLTGQTANISATTLFATVATGVYRISGYIVLTTTGGASSTLPSIVLTWTDANNSVVQTLTLTPTNAGNVTTDYQQATGVISALTATNIQYATTGYASGTPATMQYALHLKLEQLF